MLLKCDTQYVSKFGKLDSGHKTERSPFSFQFQTRAMSKNVQTSRRLCSFRMSVRLRSKSFKLSFEPRTWTENFQMHTLGLEKAEEAEIKLPTFVKSQRKQGNSRKASPSASLMTWKPLTVWITTSCGKFFKRWEFQTTLTVSWEICIWVKKQNLTWNNWLV